MFVHPDPATNRALTNALFDEARDISDHVVFDWANDGAFSHRYSDLSEILTACDLERATLTSDMPEEVNTIQGYSSAELTLTLHGTRDGDSLSISEVLSPFQVGGPFFNRNLTGTDLRYWRRVHTSFGDVDIRQFTGVVRDIQFNRRAQTVTLVCSDVAQWVNTSGTLPHWAVDEYKVTDWKLGAARPINVGWALGELLRQAGTPIGPKERSDCIASISGMGSLLHSIGSRSQEFKISTDRHTLPYGPAAPWKLGKYGPVLKSVDATGQARVQATNFIQTAGAVDIPTSGGGSPRNIGMNMWAESNGDTTNRPHPSAAGSGTYYTDGAVMALGFQTDRAIQNLVFNVGNNGQAFATMYNPTGSLIKTWVWANQPKGFHYFDLNWRFRSDSITPVLTVDGVAQSPISGTPHNAGWVEQIPNLISSTTAHLTLIVMDPAQHFQVYHGGESAVYRAGQEHPPTTKDGLPWIDFGGTLAELSYLPEVWNSSVWDVVQKMANAEFAAIYTNEYGQLVWAPHAKLRQSATTPPGAEYTVDNILDMVVNPSLDQYRNEVNIAYVNRSQRAEDAWSPDGWQQFLVPDNNAWHTFGPYQVDDVVEFTSRVYDRPGWSDWPDLEFPSTKDQLSRMCSVFVTNLTIDGSDPDHVWSTTDGLDIQGFIDMAPDQRSFTLRFKVAPDSRTTGLWLGARVAPTSSNGAADGTPGTGMWLKAKVLTGKKTGWHTLQNASEVAEFGRSVLILKENEWRQTFATAVAIAPEVLADTVTPTPIVTGLEIPDDPRLQITDTVALVPGNGITGIVMAQIIGIRRSVISGTASLDLRIVKKPTTWVLGQPGASELGVTTILGD